MVAFTLNLYARAKHSTIEHQQSQQVAPNARGGDATRTQRASQGIVPAIGREEVSPTGLIRERVRFSLLSRDVWIMVGKGTNPFPEA